MKRRDKARVFVLLVSLAFSGCKNPLVDQILGDKSEIPAAYLVNNGGFTSLEALSYWLRNAVQNTRDNPYHIVLEGFSLESLANGADPENTYFDALGGLFSALWGKYVVLDLSGCRGTEIPDSYANNRPNREMILSLVLPSSVTRIGANAFAGCTGLAAITLPASLTAIGDQAFTLTGLTAITLPDSLTAIGNRAFSFCTALTTITLPSSVTGIGDSAFSNCTNLTEISLPASAEIPDGGAFTGCSKLTFTVTGTGPYRASAEGKMLIKDNAVLAYPSAEGPVAIPAGITAVGDYAFSDTKISSVTFPAGLTAIGDSAFSNCRALTSITLPDSVTGIGSRAFNNCRSLASITLPASLTIIGNNTFAACAVLTSITLPASLTIIGGSAFSNCLSLTTITLPASLTSIGNGAFGTCSALVSITLPASLTSIGSGAFRDCVRLSLVSSRAVTPPNIDGSGLGLGPACDVQVPASSVDAYKNAEGWKSYAGQITGI